MLIQNVCDSLHIDDIGALGSTYSITSTYTPISVHVIFARTPTGVSTSAVVRLPTFLCPDSTNRSAKIRTVGQSACAPNDRLLPWRRFQLPAAWSRHVHVDIWYYVKTPARSQFPLSCPAYSSFPNTNSFSTSVLCIFRPWEFVYKRHSFVMLRKLNCLLHSNCRYSAMVIRVWQPRASSKSAACFSG